MVPTAVSYELGPDAGALMVHTTKAGLGARLAHDLVIEATTWSGSLVFDPSDLTASHVEVEVSAKSLTVVGSSGGLTPLSDADRQEIARNINDKALETAGHPKISFCSTSFSGQESRYAVTGDLTIKGTSRTVVLVVTVEGQGQVMVHGTITQSQFGIKPYSALLGALKVSDDVEVRAALALPVS